MTCDVLPVAMFAIGAVYQVLKKYYSTAITYSLFFLYYYYAFLYIIIRMRRARTVELFSWCLIWPNCWEENSGTEFKRNLCLILDHQRMPALIGVLQIYIQGASKKHQNIKVKPKLLVPEYLLVSNLKFQKGEHSALLN